MSGYGWHCIVHARAGESTDKKCCEHAADIMPKGAVCMAANGVCQSLDRVCLSRVKDNHCNITSSILGACYVSPPIRDAAAAARHAMQRQREYLERIQPFTQIMANLLAVQPVSYVIRVPPQYVHMGVFSLGGSVEHRVQWNPEAKAIYDQCEEQIRAIAREYQPEGMEGGNDAKR